ncbi:TetR/AcrR family transcriptional regulator [Actinoplanes sp. L3-i22]|uniref:TetR/AcrR family transcriptional regulator n=1 Tax=Actinoplanes sp. L3-i22 TaxID=2836373 RepID=UPI001C849C92|nr:TetR/AcrR family transcriptional regulator [Actinoplanes sp. L3-i22]
MSETARRRAAYANGERKRAEIVDAALAVFARKGFRRFSLRQIAEELGTTHVSLRYHFGTKDGLLRAVLDEREDRDRPWREGVLREKGLFDGVPEIIRRNATRRGVVHLDATLQAEGIADDHPVHEFVRRREQVFHQDLRRLLEIERDGGRLRAGLDPGVVAWQLVALIEGLQVQWLYDEGVDVSGHLSAFMDYLRA